MRAKPAVQTLFLEVLRDGRVDVVFHGTFRGRLVPAGQRIMVAPWSDVLAAIAPTGCRVLVRVEPAALAKGGTR